jgi:hypothetical protein
MNAVVIYEICRACAEPVSVNRGLEPIASISEPPAGVTDGDRCGERPPQRKRHVCNEAEHAKRDPKYFPLHMPILDASELVMSRRRAKMFQSGMLSGITIPVNPK